MITSDEAWEMGTTGTLDLGNKENKENKEQGNKGNKGNLASNLDEEYLGSTVKSYENFDDMPMFRDENNEVAMNLLGGISSYGFDKPSIIQQKTIVPLAQGRNVIGQAQSGTGKTGAFVIGTLAHFDPADKHVQLIYLAHTHELAEQIMYVINAIGNKLLKPPTVHGDISDTIALCVGQRVSVEQNIMQIRKGCQILIGTPGRIKDLVTREIHKTPLISPHHVKAIILDEADRLLSDKFVDEIKDILCRLDPDSRPKPLQIGIFSATMAPNILEVARDVCVPCRYEMLDWKSHPCAPIEVLIPVEDLTLDGIAQYYYELNVQRRDDAFKEKINFIGTLNEIQVVPQCIVYVNTQNTATYVCNELANIGMETRCIHGKMSSKARMDVVNDFRHGKINVLVSTDLLSRGIDVQQVSLVINFELPFVMTRECDIDEDRMAEYLHRIGRSGRYGRRGIAINLISSPAEQTRLEAICDYYKTKIVELPDDVHQIYK
jgi:superfamily II DNA/RNA helicase